MREIFRVSISTVIQTHISRPICPRVLYKCHIMIIVDTQYPGILYQIYTSVFFFTVTILSAYFLHELLTKIKMYFNLNYLSRPNVSIASTR